MQALILKPIISEKSMMLAANRVYSFEVPLSTNKIEVARAVAATFSVDVTDVRISITKGKVKRFKGKAGKRADVKKAYVALKAGQSIKIFEAEADEKETKKTAKADKKLDKKVEKKAEAKSTKAEAK